MKLYLQICQYLISSCLFLCCSGSDARMPPRLDLQSFLSCLVGIDAVVTCFIVLRNDRSIFSSWQYCKLGGCSYYLSSKYVEKLCQAQFSILKTWSLQVVCIFGCYQYNTIETPLWWMVMIAKSGLNLRLNPHSSQLAMHVWQCYWSYFLEVVDTCLASML